MTDRKDEPMEPEVESLRRALHRPPTPPPGAMELALDQALAAFDALPPLAPEAAPPGLAARLRRRWQALVPGRAWLGGGVLTAGLTAGLAALVLAPALRPPAPEAPVPPRMMAPAPDAPAPRMAAPMRAPADKAAGMADLTVPEDPWDALAQALNAGAPADIAVADLVRVLLDPLPDTPIWLPSAFADPAGFELRPPAPDGDGRWQLRPLPGATPPEPDRQAPDRIFAGAVASVVLALEHKDLPLAAALVMAETAARPADAPRLALLRRWAGAK